MRDIKAWKTKMTHICVAIATNESYLNFQTSTTEHTRYIETIKLSYRHIGGYESNKNSGRAQRQSRDFSREISEKNYQFY